MHLLKYMISFCVMAVLASFPYCSDSYAQSRSEREILIRDGRIVNPDTDNEGSGIPSLTGSIPWMKNVSHETGPYISQIYTIGGLVIFSYTDQCTLTVFNSWNNAIWQGILDSGEYQYFSGNDLKEGHYHLSGTGKYSCISGNPVNDVVGYFALDEAGKPLSTHFYTYMCEGDFFIWSYAENNHILLKDLITGEILWNSYLNRGGYHRSALAQNRYLELISDFPASLQVYHDCGFFYPASNNSFYGTEFYGFSNYDQERRRICIIGYSDNTQFTIEEVHGVPITSGVVHNGEVWAQHITNKAMHISSSSPVTVCAMPYVESEGIYYYLAEVKGRSGTGIDRFFYAPCINLGHLDILSFEDETFIAIQKLGSQTDPISLTLNANEHFRLDTEFGLYRIETSNRCSVIESGGRDAFGCDYMTLYFNKQPDFQIIVSPDTIQLLPGRQGSCSVRYRSIYGFDGMVDLELDSSNRVSDYYFLPTSIDSSTTSVLSLKLSIETDPGVYPVSIVGTSDSNTSRDTLYVEVGAPSFVPIRPYTLSPQISGDTFQLDVTIGDANHPVHALSTISYTLRWDNQWLEPLSDNVVIGDIWQNGTTVILNSQWNTHSDSIAISINPLSLDYAVDGYGVSNRMFFHSRRETPHNTLIPFRITSVSARDPEGNYIHLSPVDFELLINRPEGVRPNPFTPNGDGFNDQVEFHLPRLKNFGGLITIYNVWGKKVRHIENGFIWDGLDDNGRELLPGAYLYIVKSEGIVIAKGIIGLAR